MKIFISGKGGCGKSTVSALLAKEMNRRGFKVLALDTDESNFGFHAQLGMKDPEDFMNYFGGKKVLFNKVKDLPERWKSGELPDEYISRKENIRLLSMGKIQSFGEGCACPINVLSSRFLEILDLEPDEFLIADTDAGIEHLGRGVDKGCDIILVIIDPTLESIKLSGKIAQMAAGIDKPYYYILNKVDEETEEILLQSVDADRVIAAVPDERSIFTANLKGEELDFPLGEIGKVVDFLEDFRSRVA
jgi:CO dehydrogenase maturation factor